MNQNKFSVVIVTYNRLNLLKECISCVLTQTLSANEIFIINNCSTDGTTDYLNDISKTEKNIFVNHQAENLGGAGGFYVGVEQAVKGRSDWIVIIDDDAMLDKDYLLNINESINKHSDVQAFSGSVVTNEIIQLSHRRKIKGKWALDEYEIPLKEYSNNEFSYNISTFCGLVVKKELVQKIGLPMKDFFIWYDDSEYSLRIAQYSNIINNNKAFLNHKTKIGVVNNDQNKPLIFDWRMYYETRNRLYSYKKYHYPIMYLRVLVGRYLLILKSKFNKNTPKDIHKKNKAVLMDGIKDSKQGKLGKHEIYHP